jgi:hypothetical protein
MLQPELKRLLEAVKPHPLLQSVVIESMSDEEWLQYVADLEKESTGASPDSAAHRATVSTDPPAPELARPAKRR